jgi:hypothetical protein
LPSAVLGRRFVNDHLVQVEWAFLDDKGLTGIGQFWYKHLVCTMHWCRSHVLQFPIFSENPVLERVERISPMQVSRLSERIALFVEQKVGPILCCKKHWLNPWCTCHIRSVHLFVVLLWQVYGKHLWNLWNYNISRHPDCPCSSPGWK